MVDYKAWRQPENDATINSRAWNCGFGFVLSRQCIVRLIIYGRKKSSVLNWGTGIIAQQVRALHS